MDTFMEDRQMEPEKVIAGKYALIVDDEQDIADTIKYSLELRGFEVDVAYDGLSALRKGRSGKYAVMVLDVMLPGKNGYEVSRLLKEEMETGAIEPFKILLITARKLDNELREEFGSNLTVRPSNTQMLAIWQVELARCAPSAGAIGCRRLFTQSRKLRTWLACG